MKSDLSPKTACLPAACTTDTAGARIPASVWAIAGLAVALRVGLALATRFTSEDYLITLRYAEHLASGQGLTYNPGERVLGTTTPLYTLFLALVSYVGLPATACGKLSNILADGALCVLMYRWMKQMGRGEAAWIAAFIVTVMPLHLQWAISGMETSLVTACGIWVWVLFTEQRLTNAYAAAALLFLLRWDGLLLVVVLTLACIRRDRRLPWRGLALFLIMVSPWLLGAAWYFGNPIPVTATAKATVYGWRAALDSSWLLRTLPSLPKLFARFFGTPGYAMLSCLALVGLWRSLRDRTVPLLVPCIWFGVYWAAFLGSRVLLFPWYLAPPLPVYEALVAVGAQSLWQTARERRPRLMRSGAMVAALPIFVPVVFVIGSSLFTFVAARREQVVEEQVRIPLALWLKAHSAPTDHVMLEPIGTIGYYSQLPVLDVVGLVTPGVLPAYSPQNQAPMLNIARKFHPEWCVLRPGEIDRIQRAAAATGRPWEDDYKRVQTFHDRSNRNIYDIFRRTSPRHTKAEG